MKLLEGFSHLQPNYNPDENFSLLRSNAVEVIRVTFSLARLSCSLSRLTQKKVIFIKTFLMEIFTAIFEGKTSSRHERIFALAIDDQKHQVAR